MTSAAMDLQGLVEQEQLPVLPTILAKMLALKPGADDYFDQLVELAESEPMFALRVLRLAGSARYARGPSVRTIRRAVALLGSSATTELLMGFAVAQVFIPRTDCEKRLWLHALQVAIGARIIAGAFPVKVDAGEAYLAGLLHDLGRFAMLRASPDKLEAMGEVAWGCDERSLEAETRDFGVDHSELGALLAESWELPERLQQVLRLHHEKDLGRLPRDLAALVTVIQQADQLSVGLIAAGDDAPDRVRKAADAGVIRARSPSLRAQQLKLLVPRIERDTAEQASVILVG